MNKLESTLVAMGAVRFRKTLVACCPFHQPEEQDPDRYKIVISRGSVYPVIFQCMKCVVKGGSYHNYQLWIKTCNHFGLDRQWMRGEFEDVEIDEMWDALPLRYKIEVIEPVEVADAELLHEVYQTLLESLPLTVGHAAWLVRHGLTPDECLQLGYGSAPATINTAEICERVADKFDDDELYSVPGFVYPDKLLLRENAILIPCRNELGQILGIKQRLLTGKSRMRLLSSGPYSGPKGQVVCHCPVGMYTGSQFDELWITEGERKADIYWLRTSKPVVGIPGVSTWPYVLSTVEKLLSPKGKLILALDNDKAGINGTAIITPHLLTTGHPLEIATWSDAKGIDDAIIINSPITTTPYCDTNEKTRFTPYYTKPRSGAGNYKVKVDDPNRPLFDWEIEPYIKQTGPILRDKLKCWQPTVSKLIKSGTIKMTKTTNGQLLEVI